MKYIKILLFILPLFNCNAQNKITLEYIEKEVNKEANKINVPKGLLPTYGYSKGGAYPHIEIDNEGFHYIIIERKRELDHKITDNLDELLFFVFDEITNGMSQSYELKHRDYNLKFKEQRLIRMRKQEELLGKMKDSWKERAILEHREFLKDSSCKSK